MVPTRAAPCAGYSLGWVGTASTEIQAGMVAARQTHQASQKKSYAACRHLDHGVRHSIYGSNLRAESSRADVGPIFSQTRGDGRWQQG